MTSSVKPHPAHLPTQVTRSQMNAVFATVVLAMLVASLDQMIVSTALPTIVADVGGAGHVSWVITSYLLTETVSTVVVGKFGDLFGRKVVFQVSLVVFTVGSFFSGYADDMGTLIAFRGLQGLGAGGLMITATALIADVIPLRDRGRYQGALGAVFGVTTVAGPLLGGLFTDHLSWRWAFYVNIPIAVVVVLMAARTIPDITRGDRPRVDYLGVLLVALGASGLTLATSWGGTEYPWGSPQIVGLFVASSLALVAFVFVELHAPEPILPMRLFGYRVFSICSLLSFVVGFGMMGSIAFLPTYLQFVNGASATASGLRMMPMVLGILVTAIVSGTLVSRTGRYRLYPILGSAIAGLGMLLLATMDPRTSVVTGSLYMLVLGAGLGLMMQTLTLVVQNTVDYRDLGTATSGVSFFRALGGGFGVAIVGTMYAARLARELPAATAAAGTDPQLALSPQSVHSLPAVTQAPILDAYASALQGAFAAAAIAMAVALVVALLLPQVEMRGLPGATGAGDGFALAEPIDEERTLETLVSHLLRRESPAQAEDVIARSGTRLPHAQLWGLTVVGVGAFQVDAPSVSRSQVAARLGLPDGVLDSFWGELEEVGLLEVQGDRLSLSEKGRAELEKVVEVWRSWLLNRLEQTLPGTRTPDESAALHAAVERIVWRLVREDARPVRGRHAAEPTLVT